MIEADRPTGVDQPIGVATVRDQPRRSSPPASNQPAQNDADDFEDDIPF